MSEYLDDTDASNDANDNSADVDVTKEFRETVIKFVKIDDLVRKKTEEMAELKNQKKPLETFILKYLDQVDETVVEITNGKLRKNKSETKAAVNMDIIKEAISKKVEDPKVVNEILDIMEELRPKKININLKRTSQHTKKASLKKAKTSVKKAIKKA